MAKLKGFQSFISQLSKQRTDLEKRLRRLDAALAVLGKLNQQRLGIRSGRTLSAAARRRISLAQKARWAKSTAIRRQSAKRRKRRMSARRRRG